MGSSKKHKKHKSERREKYEEYSNNVESSQLQRGLKLILKVGPNNTPEYGSHTIATVESIPLSSSLVGPPTAAEAMCSSPLMLEELQETRPEKHKKSKKKKKKKDREKKHKHHKEKKRHKGERYACSEDMQREVSVAGTEDLTLIINQDSQLMSGSLSPPENPKFLTSTDGRVSNAECDSSQDAFSFIDDDNTQALPEKILFHGGMGTENSTSCRSVSKPIIEEQCENLFLESPASSSHQSSSMGMAVAQTSSSHQSSSMGMAVAQTSKLSCGSPTKPLPELIILSSSPSLAGSTPDGASSTAALTPKTLEAPKTPSSSSESGREPRSCVMKLKQQHTPLNKLLEHLLRVLEKRDTHQFFAWPVTDEFAPGYSRIIAKPMDFYTMRQKIDNNEYCTLAEFTDDFHLICDNAIKYNHVDTVYHKAAKRLLQVGNKQLAPENLMRSLKPLAGFIRELTAKELGFEVGQSTGEWSINGDYEYQAIADSADESTSTGAEEILTPAQMEDAEKRRTLRLENQPKSRFEPYVDDMTSEEILAQVQGAAQAAKKRLALKGKAHSMAFLRQNKDGTTSMNTLITDNSERPEKVVNLGDLGGKMQHNSNGQGQGCREDHSNEVKTLKPLHYAPFTCFAPTLDSRFSTLNKEETQLVMQTYGDAISTEYAESILQFTKDSNYATMMANSLLDVLTNGDHTKCMKDLYDLQVQNYEQQEALKCFNNLGPIIDSTASSEARAQIEQEYEKYKNIRIDFNRLRSLNNLGIDVGFLDEIEKEMKNFELTRRLQEHLSNNLNLIDKLRNTQNDRSTQSHLSLVAQSPTDETQLVNQITQQLTDAVKKIADSYNLRKAMGVSFVGLPGASQQQHSPLPAILQAPGTLPNINSNINFPQSSSTINTSQQAGETNASNTSLAMEIDEEVTTTAGGDLENELREFLESEPALHAASSSNSDDNNLVAQLLMN